MPEIGGKAFAIVMEICHVFVLQMVVHFRAFPCFLAVPRRGLNGEFFAILQGASAICVLQVQVHCHY